MPRGGPPEGGPVRHWTLSRAAPGSTVWTSTGVTDSGATSRTTTGHMAERPPATTSLGFQEMRGGTDSNLVTFSGVEKETTTVELHGVDAQVNEHTESLGLDDESVWMELDDPSGDGGDDRHLSLTDRDNGDPGTDESLGEDRVRHVRERMDIPGHGRGDRRHQRRSSISSTRVSASGPTTT